MAEHGRPYWASERVHGPGGRFRVVVTRVPANRSPDRRDRYSAALLKSGDEGEETVEAGFWERSSAPHDADKIAFRDRARRAAEAAGGSDEAPS